jgi:hypothetical protein
MRHGVPFQVAPAPRAAPEDVALDGIQDHAELHHAVHHDTDGHRELGEPVDEVGRAVQRVHNPGRAGRVATRPPGLLRQDGVIGEALGDGPENDLLGLAIRHRDQVVARFLGHLVGRETAESRHQSLRSQTGDGLDRVQKLVTITEWHGGLLS